MEEQDLLIRLKCKSEASFDLLYRNYSPVLYGVIYNILKEEEEANDLLQEVFIKIWSKIDQYDQNKGRLFTWMINIARNLAIDRLRSADYRNHKLENFVRDKCEAVIDKEYREQLHIESIGLNTILENLDEHSKCLVYKLYFEGYTQSDLAEEMKIPLGTLKTRVRSAIRKLRKYFEYNESDQN